MYSDLHCTKADQKLVDKISHLKKTMNQTNLSILSSLPDEENDNSKEETSNIEKREKRETFVLLINNSFLFALKYLNIRVIVHTACKIYVSKK